MKTKVFGILLILLALTWWSLPVLAEEPEGQPGDVEQMAPPDEAELGEPIQEAGYITRDDVEDEEGEPVDIFDLTFVAARYDTTDPAADINLDGTVDIFDLAILANSYGKAEAEVNTAAVPRPEPMPIVEEGGETFGAFDLEVDPEPVEVEIQSASTYRPLRIGVGINYVRVYDYMDSGSAPDLYSAVSVGGVWARTNTLYNQYESWPSWRLGWWRYNSFPRDPNYATLPIQINLRDDDGYYCYGYYGCRYSYQTADLSPLRYNRSKTLRFSPASCTVTDEAGTHTYGYWVDSNRCRVYLHTWGTEWPRGYASYFIDAQWD